MIYRHHPVNATKINRPVPRAALPTAGRLTEPALSRKTEEAADLTDCFASGSRQGRKDMDDMEQRESKDVTQKNLEGFPDVAADILNVFIHGGTTGGGGRMPVPRPH